MKKMTITAALLSVVLLAGCAGSKAPAATSEQAPASVSEQGTEVASGQSSIATEDTAVVESIVGTQIANPWQDCADQAEAEKLAGFTITLPATVDDDYAAPVFRALPDMVLEVLYYAKDGDDNTLMIRKGPGSEDISGDYNGYAYTGTLTVGESTVQVRGEEPDDLKVATWQQNGYTYAVSTQDDLDESELTALIGAIS